MSEKKGCSGTVIAIVVVSFFVLGALGAGGAYLAFKTYTGASNGNEDALREFVRAAAAGEQTAARTFVAQAAVDATSEGAVLAGITDLGRYGAMQTFNVSSSGFQSNVGMPTVWSYDADVTFERGAGDLEFGVIQVGDQPRIRSFSYNIRPTEGATAPAATGEPTGTPTPPTPSEVPAAIPPTTPTPAVAPPAQPPAVAGNNNYTEADEALVRSFMNAIAARNFRSMFALMSSAGQAAIDRDVTGGQIAGLPNWGALLSTDSINMDRSVDTAEFGRVRVFTARGLTATTSLQLTLEIGRENGSPVVHRFDLAYEPLGGAGSAKP